jgi:hypothetical protein
MSSVEDEIGLLVEDIQRWAGQDARIHQALEQLMKLYGAEIDALAFEARELERALVQQTTEIESRRIAAAQPQGRWRNHG